MKFAMKKIVSKQECVCAILLSAFSLIYLLGYLSVISLKLANTAFVFIGSFSILYSWIHKKNTCKLKFALIFVFLYTVFWILSFIYNSNSDLVEILWPLAFMGVGNLFINFRISDKLTGSLFIIFILIISFVIIVRGGADYIGGTSSRNNVSVSIVLFLAMHFIACYNNQKSITILFPILALIGCFLAIGRSGIILSLIIVFFFICFEYSNGEAKIRSIKLLMGTIILLLVLFCLLLVFSPSLFADVLYNFEKRGIQSTRLIIWRDYIKQAILNFGNFFFGAKIEGTSVLNQYHYNLHNSFLMLHAKYGILGFSMVVVLLIKTIGKLLHERNMYLLSPLLFVLFRMNFDYTNFNGILDIVMIYFLVYSLKQVKVEK